MMYEGIKFENDNRKMKIEIPLELS